MVGKEQIKNDVESPLVSICIPTYNRAKKIERAVKSAQNSTYPNIEIIISDNASTDCTEQICETLKSQDSRISYHRQRLNIGASKNFEFVRSAASGKYFMWLSDDDYIDRSYVYACVGLLERNCDLVLASGKVLFVTDDGTESFESNAKELTDNRAALRIAKYIWNVGDNSGFYGIYVREKIEDIPLLNILAADWSFVANVVQRGTYEITNDAILYREFESTTSSNLRSLVASIGAPRWQARLTWLAKAINMANSVPSYDYSMRGNRVVRLAAWFAVFSIVVAKESVNVLRRTLSKVWFVRSLYETYIASSIKR